MLNNNSAGFFNYFKYLYSAKGVNNDYFWYISEILIFK